MDEKQARRKVAQDAAVALAARPDALFNDRLRPATDNLSERPEHRVFIVLKSQGYSVFEIAKMTGYDRVTVSRVLRAPWARSRLLDLIKERAERSDPIATFIQNETLDSLQTLVEIRDSEESGPQARLAAARDLIDRALGRPVQPVEAKHGELHSVEEIDRELATLEAKASVLLGRSTNEAASAQ